MNIKNNAATWLMVLLSGSLLVFATSCSTMRTIWSWPKSFFEGTKANHKDKEVAQFLSTVRPSQGNPDSHYLLACYYQERGNHQQAIEEFEKVLLIDPGYFKAYNGMGISYDLLGNFPGAVEAYEAALLLNPSLDFVQNNLGYSLFLQGDLDKAIAAFKKAIALNEREQRFHNNLGLAYAEKGQFDLAMAEFKLGGDEAKAHYNLAQFYYKKGWYGEAKSHYAQALKLNPSSTIIKTGLEATGSLASIFQPATRKAKAEGPVVPAPATSQEIRKQESETAVSLRPTTLGEEKIVRDSPQVLIHTVTGLEETKETLKPNNSPKPVGIEISNGNGVNRMAGRVGNYLQQRGLKVVRFTNADRFNYAGTKIFYQKGHHESAKRVAEQFPALQNMEELKKLDRSNIQIKVLIGRDLIPHNKLFEDRKRS